MPITNVDKGGVSDIEASVSSAHKSLCWWAEAVDDEDAQAFLEEAADLLSVALGKLECFRLLPCEDAE